MDGPNAAINVTPSRYPGGMVRPLLDAGVYDAREVGHLLGLPPDLVARWSVPDGKGRPAIVPPSLDRAFSFLDLVSLAVASELWRRNVPESDVRKGVALLTRETGLTHPLAQRQVVEALATCSVTFLWNMGDGWFDLGKGGQGVFEEVVRIDVRSIDFDDLGRARRWQPAPDVVLDPKVQAGAPCISGTRIPTATIASMLESERAELVAEDLDLELALVLAAADFEHNLAAGAGISG